MSSYSCNLQPNRCDFSTRISNWHLPQVSVHIIIMSLKKSMSRLEIDLELEWKTGEISSYPVCQYAATILGNSFSLSQFLLSFPLLIPVNFTWNWTIFAVGTVLECVYALHLAQLDPDLGGDHWVLLKYR